MASKTMIVSRARNLFSTWRNDFEALGFKDPYFSHKEKDALMSEICRYKPDNLLIGCGFYKSATPYVLGMMLKKLPKMNVAAVNIHEFPDCLGARFIAKGANSYVNIMDGMEEFNIGMKTVRNGGQYIASGIRRQIAIQADMPEPGHELTERQFEIMTLLCCGFQEIEVADTLQVSKKTVDYHKQVIYKKLDARNTAEMIRAAQSAGYVQPDGMNFYPDEKPDGARSRRGMK